MTALPNDRQLPVSRCLSVDLEVTKQDHRIRAFAGVRWDSGESFVFPGTGDRLLPALAKLDDLSAGADFLLGHNLISFDWPHIQAVNPNLQLLRLPVVDTLRLNPLAFPRNPYHHLVKHYQDGQLKGGRRSDPDLDARLALEVFSNQLDSFSTTSGDLLAAWHWLTSETDGTGFDKVFRHVRQAPRPTRAEARYAIEARLTGAACRTSARYVMAHAATHGWALAYALAWLSVVGGTATYTVKLNTVPTDDVTVAITSSDPGAATVVPATLTFTPLDWNAAKTVTVTGVEDGDRNDESVALSNDPSDGGYDGVGTEEVALSVADNDVPGVRVSRTALTVTEEDTNGNTYTVVLSSQPTASVTVTVGGFSGTDVTANPASLTFTTQNWNTPRTVTVTAAGDADLTDDTVTLTHGAASTDTDYDGIAVAGVTVTVTDNDDGAPPPPPITGGGGGGFGPALDAPKFVDGFRTSRPLDENAQVGDAVGDPVTATHPNDDAVTYSLSGTDASLFTVDEDTGQIRLGQAVTLALGQTYTVNLTATDSGSTGAIIIVDIAVEEAPYHRYDLNRNGSIEKNEVLEAVADYFSDLIEKPLVLEVISLYFAG